MELLSYERIAWRRAIQNAWGLARGHILGAIFAAAASAAAYPVFSLLAPEIDLMEKGLHQILEFLIGPAVVLAVILIVFRIRAGSELYFELVRKIENIEGRLAARLAFSIPEAGLETINDGTSSDTIGGKRYTNISSQREYLSVHCRNIGTNELKSVRAYLVSALRIGENGQETSLGMVEAVELPWDRRGKALETAISPEETKRLYIGTVRQNGMMYLHRDTIEYPVEYHQIFADYGKYRLEIKFSSAGEFAANLRMDVETLVVESKPNSMTIPQATVTLLDPGAILAQP